jgi:hypothetical protein
MTLIPVGGAMYSQVSDEVSRLATISIQTGTDPGDPNYEPTSLVDENPAKAAKIASTTGAWLFTFASAQRIDLASLIHHDFDAGVSVHLQGNASNSWGSPTLDAAFTIPAWLGSGTSRWPVNPWLDLTTVPGYSTSGFQYWRLVITSNSQNLALGQTWFASLKRQLNPDLRWEFQRSIDKPIIENQTAWKVSTIYSRKTAIWSLDGDHLMDDALRDSLYAQFYDVDGRAHPWLFIPDAEVNASYLVRWKNPTRGPIKYSMGDSTTNLAQDHFAIEEVSRGMRLGL